MQNRTGWTRLIAAWAALSACAWAQEPATNTAPKGTNTVTTTACMVTIETSMGTIKAELWPDKAPATVSNFLAYVDEKFYDGLVFHRVINRFMIQGGGFSPDMRQKRTHPPVKNEARADVPNKRGTMAMARTPVVDSATSQFFINHADNAFLDHRGKSDTEFGYCVFGKVTEGLDVLDAIANVKTTVVAGQKDVPVEPVTIKSVRRATP